MHPEGRWKHEEGSVMMLRYLMRENSIKPRDLGLSETDVLFIEEIILGVKENARKGRASDKFYLYDIVNNVRSGTLKAT